MTQATLALIIGGAIEIIKLAPKWIEDAKERGEMTAEEGAALDEKIANLKKQPHWQIEP